jgi:hypothetical protein
MMEDNVQIMPEKEKIEIIDIQHKATEYNPTPKELALLQAMINPENFMKPVTELCRLAKCDRTVYYDAIKKDGFKALVKEISRDLTTGAVIPIVHSFIKHGLRGSFQHAKVVLEMAGAYSEKQDVQLNVTFEQLLKKALESGE